MKKWFLLAGCVLLLLSFVLLPFPLSQTIAGRLKVATVPLASAALALVGLAGVFLLAIFLFYLKAKIGGSKDASVH